ncbi:MAG: hypothetical protein HQL77_17520 [Magnetococcales bacterium]|nr:hypothetical protein [Magnetococcales bacterium]
MNRNGRLLHQSAQWALRHTTSFLTGGFMVLAITTAYTADLPTFTLPYILSNNSIADANQVNANFNKLNNEILVNRTAINNLHFGIMANGVEVGVLQTFQPFSTVSSVTGQTPQGYNFSVDQSGALVTTITDSDLSVQTINTSQSCSGSAQPTLLIKNHGLPAKTIFKINFSCDPVVSGGNSPNGWCSTWPNYSTQNPVNGTYVYQGTEQSFASVTGYALNNYSQCNATQTFTGPFFTPIAYVHANYSAPDMTPLGLTPNNQATTGVPNNGFTGPITVKVQH